MAMSSSLFVSLVVDVMMNFLKCELHILISQCILLYVQVLRNIRLTCPIPTRSLFVGIRHEPKVLS
jgi:hypothetical protein